MSRKYPLGILFWFSHYGCIKINRDAQNPSTYSESLNQCLVAKDMFSKSLRILNFRSSSIKKQRFLSKIDSIKNENFPNNEEHVCLSKTSQFFPSKYYFKRLSMW